MQPQANFEEVGGARARVGRRAPDREPPRHGTVLERLREIDRELARLGRGADRMRLRIGEALDILVRTGGLGELGFSKPSDYVLERCEHDARWGRESREVAARLANKEGLGLPCIRQAVMLGELSWSMARLLARHATPDDEHELLAEAEDRTVAGMLRWLKERAEAFNAAAGAQAGGGAKRGRAKRKAVPQIEEIEETPNTPLDLRITPDEVVLLHGSRVLIDLLDRARPNDDHFWSALLAEGANTLTSKAGPDALQKYVEDLEHAEVREVERKRRAAKRREREQEAEDKLDRTVGPIELEPFPPLPSHPNAIDAEIRRLGADLISRDLRLGQLARELFSLRGWEVLGYASKEQYARERAGMSLSSLQHRMSLARRVEELPEIGTAILDGKLGYEASMLVGRIATPDNVHKWIDRAKKRTLKHLREDVAAVELECKIDINASMDPPDDETLKRVKEIERSVANGELLHAALMDPPRDSQISVTDEMGREVRYWISQPVREELERVRALFERLRPPDSPLTFVAFLCLSFFQTWLPVVDRNKHKWKDVHDRDGHQCTSPVCTERDVEGHHVRFRSKGGSDHPSNITSAGSFCHRPGIHEGRIRCHGTAPDELEWWIGRIPIMVIRGRDKELLAPFTEADRR